MFEGPHDLLLYIRNAIPLQSLSSKENVLVAALRLHVHDYHHIKILHVWLPAVTLPLQTLM